MQRGTSRHIESEADQKRRSGADEELFTRLIYYGTVQLRRTEEETWLMSIGYLLDLWECHKQFLGTPNLNGSCSLIDYPDGI